MSQQPAPFSIDIPLRNDAGWTAAGRRDMIEHFSVVLTEETPHILQTTEVLTARDKNWPKISHPGAATVTPASTEKLFRVSFPWVGEGILSVHMTPVMPDFVRAPCETIQAQKLSSMNGRWSLSWINKALRKLLPPEELAVVDKDILATSMRHCETLWNINAASVMLTTIAARLNATYPGLIDVVRVMAGDKVITYSLSKAFDDKDPTTVPPRGMFQA